MMQSEDQIQQRPYDVFWNFFVEMKEEIEGNYEENPQMICHAIGQVLDSVAPELSFELGRHPEGYFEFILVAGGVSDNIPIVIDMYNAAPEIEGWVVTPFRPRQKLGVINMPDVDYDPNDFYYTSNVCENGYTHLNVYIKGYTLDRQQEFGGMIFMFLDVLLGELDVMTRIGNVEIFSFPQEVDVSEIKPISVLQQEIDQRYPLNA